MKQKLIQKWKKEKGSATIEAIVSFTGFLFVIFTILTIVNFCRTQMLISNAIDTAAKELSQYSYFYEMSGLQKYEKILEDNKKVGAEHLDNVIGSVDSLYKSISKASDNAMEQTTKVYNAAEEGDLDRGIFENALKELKDDGTNIETAFNSMSAAFNNVQDDPMLYMKSIVAVAGSEALSMFKSYVIAAPLAKAFTVKHFGETTEEANETLKQLGVVEGLDGLNFRMSTIFSEKEPDEIHIVCYYKLKLLQFFSWETYEVTFCKEAIARAWLGGDNVQKVIEPEVSSESGEANTESGESDVMEEKSEEDPEAEATEETEESVDITGSDWYLNENNRGYDEKLAAFVNRLKADYNLPDHTYGAYGYYGRGNDNIVYGMDYCVDSSTAEDITIAAFNHMIEAVSSNEEEYVTSDGAKGYEPGTTKQGVYVVYVPENMPDSELDKLKGNVTKNADLYYTDAQEKYGLSLAITINYVRAGGNYDYGGAE